MLSAAAPSGEAACRLYSNLKRTLPTTQRTDDRTQGSGNSANPWDESVWPFLGRVSAGAIRESHSPWPAYRRPRRPCWHERHHLTQHQPDQHTTQKTNPQNDSQPDSQADNQTSESVTFAELGLAEPIAAVLAKRNYTTPTPIQALAIPAVLEGRDVFGCAQTGTGKTAAFALPILHDLFEAGHDGGPRRTHNGKKTQRGSRGRAPRALVLCPTRELAVQIFDSFVAYGRSIPLRHAAIFGGVSQFRQEKSLKAGVDVLIATPGRLMDLHQQGLIDLGSIEVLVLDEADRMLDMGFLPDMKRIAALTPDARQTLLFSATASKAIKALAGGLLKDPVHLETTPESTTVERINQQAYVVEKTNKPLLLRALLSREHVGRTLVFTRTKHGADRVVKQLGHNGINASAIHGNKTQNARTRALTAFKNDPQGVLVATDVASRGIDVSGITHVINFDLPGDAETYVHRVGRTARAGASGIAITFAEKAESRDLADIHRRTKADIQPGDELPEDLAGIAEPYVARAGRGPAQTAEPRAGGRSGGGRRGGYGGGGGYRGGGKKFGGGGADNRGGSGGRGRTHRGGPKASRPGGQSRGKPGGKPSARPSSKPRPAGGRASRG